MTPGRCRNHSRCCLCGYFQNQSVVENKGNVPPCGISQELLSGTENKIFLEFYIDFNFGIVSSFVLLSVGKFPCFHLKCKSLDSSLSPSWPRAGPVLLCCAWLRDSDQVKTPQLLLPDLAFLLLDRGPPQGISLSCCIAQTRIRDSCHFAQVYLVFSVCQDEWSQCHYSCVVLMSFCLGQQSGESMKSWEWNLEPPGSPHRVQIQIHMTLKAVQN